MKIESKSDQHFTVNGWLVDLPLIEHWGRKQGAGKFHGIRTALAILRSFAKGLDQNPQQTPERIAQMRLALERLIDFGYHIPPQVFEDES